MPSFLTLMAIGISFVVTLLILPFWIRRAVAAKLVGPDVHKLNRTSVAEFGGLCVIAGFLISLLFFIATKIFVAHRQENIVYVFATMLAVLIATVIGFVDDILGWKIGLRARYKVALTVFISLPIVVLNAAHSTMNLPFFGVVDFGILYPLFIVPIIIVGTSNGFNMIGGYNGLEAGQGVLLLIGISTITYLSGETYLALMGCCMIAALLAFYFFNSYPSKIFPGDTLTYPVGALFGIIAILGDSEKYALVMFIPYFLELAFKVRGSLKKESFAEIRNDGSLENQYEHWYGIEHAAIDFLKKMKIKATEKNVVNILYLFQSLFIISGILLYLV